MKKLIPIILLVIFALITIIVRQCNTGSENYRNPESITEKASPGKRGLNRNPVHINYSKHARCRMDCRHIDESEVQEILKNGKINYAKSDLKGDDCNKKYAVEGITHDSQKVRIIFAPCNDELTVVTVIDLGQEWPCNCN